MSRWLPQPVLTFVIAGLWLVVVSSFTLNSLVMAGLVGIAIPLLVRGFWTDRPHLRRPLRALGLLGRVLVDILIANLQVARRVLGPLSRLRPAFVTIPLDVSSPYVATILGSIVSLTPGTVSVEIEMEARTMLVHALDAPDPQALVATVKTRYEAPLKEIFGC
ncbi:MAG: Na+/H+ antiporter subunit E [Sphingomonadaceae bacterium]|uniref:Na+/H+ antiporter subunit E n=1 Tax=Thermaurantiacus sp. TaxID=2820283 RepID=UPI00298F193D|nr:Na+/H+ antiporter subunit E [Thermaurantiacus sp.]MCS6987618.1 Na+/H+ antiporter subunit E [Sphingomonadaceae bacterium]MDW8415219.1 Na+/H+ antiporter subunit E [Thermaurantiacus sp.]